MNPTLLFWMPVVIKCALITFLSVLMGLFFGAFVGVLVLAGLVGILFFMQLVYLFQLNTWLDQSMSTRLPDGWGSWTSVFSRLYKLHRASEKNQIELTEWLTRFRQAMYLLPDGVVIMDDVLFLEWCNPVAEKHLGLQLDKDKGMRITNVVRSPGFIDYLVLGRYDTPLTLTIQGRKLVIQVIPFENRRQILVSHDTTESDRIDKMRRDFIANASHELRTPLTVMNGFLEVAQTEPDLPTEIRIEHVKLMLEQGRRMQNLVEDMLILSRLESVDLPLSSERVPMATMLEQMVRDGNALSVGKHKIILEVDAPDIVGNIDELRSAFGNLVSNAVRYTPSGGEIYLTWRRGKNGPEFSVKDSGIGISAEHIGRLTERFYRVDKSRSRETQGTGLGLAIVKHVLLRHRGNLVIDSVIGHGSTFTVTFPYDVWYHEDEKNMSE